MPYDFQFPNEASDAHIEASKTIIYFARYLVAAPPTAVYYLSGPDCSRDYLDNAGPTAWRYFDRRRLGGYFDISAGAAAELIQVVNGERSVLAFEDRLNRFVKDSGTDPRTSTVRIIEVPAQAVTAIWHIIDGETVAFHVAVDSGGDFRTMSPEEFYEMVRKEHAAMMARYAASPHPELMGG